MLPLKYRVEFTSGEEQKTPHKFPDLPPYARLVSVGPDILISCNDVVARFHL